MILRVSKKQRMRDEILNLREEVFCLKDKIKGYETQEEDKLKGYETQKELYKELLDVLKRCELERNFHKKVSIQLKTELEELKARTKEEEAQLLKNYDVDIIILDEAVSQLKGNPDFELFVNLLHSEEGFCYTMMCKNGKEEHDFWKGKIHSYRRLITQISYEIKNLADNERKKLLDKERKKE